MDVFNCFNFNRITRLILSLCLKANINLESEKQNVKNRYNAEDKICKKIINTLIGLSCTLVNQELVFILLFLENRK